MKKFIYIVFIAALASCGGIDDGGTKGIKNYVVVNSAVPSFSVTGENGTGAAEFTSSWFVGKRSVIVFFNSECPDCEREMPKIRTAWAELQSKGIIFICISRKETVEAVAKYWNKSGFYPMPYYLSQDGAAFYKFANSYVPRIYLVGTDGKVKHFEVETFSFADGAALVELINSTI